MKCIVVSVLLLSNVTAFSSLSGHPAAAVSNNENAQGHGRLSALFMGRAAAVRAATKSKTDGKKAKTNAIFGKKIMMAVKQGGSPDPNANRMLGDIIRAAKNNNVPVDVRKNGFFRMLLSMLDIRKFSHCVSFSVFLFQEH
jgi:hypothetical protein